MENNEKGSLLIKNAYVIPVDRDVSLGKADILVRDGRIKEVGHSIDPGKAVETIEAEDCAVFPGFVQAHVHLCQTLFRGLAEDMELLPWLTERIFPLEASHDEKSLVASARLALTELLLSGVTAIQSLETSFGTEFILPLLEESGISALTGECLMDKGEKVPRKMLQDPGEAIRKTVSLKKEYSYKTRGRINVALCPRFSLSCTERLLKECAETAAGEDMRVHTHASENRTEIERVKEETGFTDIEYLRRLGLVSRRTTLVHCVHVSESDSRAIKASGASICTCPSANLKLASGIAPVYKYLDMDINTSIGSDGAPCNNRLDPFTEMRLLAKLQKTLSGPEGISPSKVLEMATINGARAMGMEKEIGSVTPGKRADLVVMGLDSPWLGPGGSIETRIVYSATPEDIRYVILNGNIVVKQRELLLWDKREAVARAREELEKLLSRAGQNA